MAVRRSPLATTPREAALANVFNLTLHKPYRGWVIVAVGFVVAFSTGPGQSFGVSSFIDPIIEDTGISRTTISVLFAVSTGVSAIMAATVSRMSDKYGPRLVLALVAGALGIACFGMALSSGFVGFFFALAALRALGQGSMFINSTLLVAQWFVAKRGRAVAVMSFGFAASNAVIPPVSRALIEDIGWRETYAVLGIMVWVLVIPATLILVRNTPEEVGLHPDGASGPPAGEAPRTEAEQGPDKRKIFTSPAFWALAVPLSVPAFVVTGLIFHQTSILDERGLSATVAASVFVPFAIASATGAAIGGLLIDRIGPARLFATSMIIMTTAVVSVLFVSSPVAGAGYAALLGMASGMTQIIMGVIWAHYYGRHRLGRVQGSAVMIMISAAAIGPLPLAAFEAAFDSFRPAIIFIAITPLIAAAAITFNKPNLVAFGAEAAQPTP